MSHATETGAELPPGRYGAPRRLPAWVAVLLVAIGLAALVPLGLAVFQAVNPEVRAAVTGFTIVSDTRVSLTIDVSKPADARVVCTLGARDRFSEQVGTTRVVIDEQVDSTVVSRSFPTSSRAVVVEVTGCAVDDQP